jgi:fructosamine-3-kinase
MLPASLKSKIEQDLAKARGQDVRISTFSHLGGGCINQAHRIELTTGERYFVKWSNNAPSDIFEKEAYGLRVLKNATSLRVPEPIVFSPPDERGPGFLILEDLLDGDSLRKFVNKEKDFHTILGHGLAELHRARGPAFGFDHDNYIGSTLQPNSWSQSWVEFFRVHRLEHIIKLLSRTRKLAREHLPQINRFLCRLDVYLGDSQIVPSLVHGDLWGGNVMGDSNGMPALIDPAVYYGHREVDIAMTTLFGGFTKRFYEAYNEVFPLSNEFETRKEIYNLYHVLNHALLFGGGYLTQALTTIKRFA